MKSISRALRKARRAKDYSQVYLAEKLGISQKHLSNIENGKSPISMPLLVDLCRVLALNLVIHIGEESYTF